MARVRARALDGLRDRDAVVRSHRSVVGARHRHDLPRALPARRRQTSRRRAGTAAPDARRGDGAARGRRDEVSTWGRACSAAMAITCSWRPMRPRRSRGPRARWQRRSAPDRCRDAWDARAGAGGDTREGHARLRVLYVSGTQTTRSRGSARRKASASWPSRSPERPWRRGSGRSSISRTGDRRNQPKASVDLRSSSRATVVRGGRGGCGTRGSGSRVRAPEPTHRTEHQNGCQERHFWVTWACWLHGEFLR